MSESDKDEKMIARKMWISNRIRDICEETGITIPELSIISGLSPEQMDKIQRGSILPSKKALESIAIVFSISVDDLLPSD
jgi:transcriptional regulator with XRE-family HTH domain